MEGTQSAVRSTHPDQPTNEFETNSVRWRVILILANSMGSFPALLLKMSLLRELSV